MTLADAKREYWAARADYDIAVDQLKRVQWLADIEHVSGRIREAASRVAEAEIAMQTAAEAPGMSRLP